jgi:hypothetical protein
LKSDIVRKTMNSLKLSMLSFVLALVLTTLSASEVVKSVPLACGAWSVVSSPNVGTNNNTLTGVAAVSNNNAWAVGNSGYPGTQQTLIERWNGKTWSVLSSPNVGLGSNVLQGVAAVSANNVWAVGYYKNSSGVGQTLVEQWNGSSWNVVSSPNAGSIDNNLFGVVALSASNIWAVGISRSSSSPQTLIEQWNGSSWSIVSSPNVPTSSQDYLYSVAAISASDIWAVGQYYNSSNIYKPLIENWNGINWNIASSPNTGSSGDNLSGVTSVPSTSIVSSVGFYTISGIDQTLTEEWNGVGWSVVSSPNAGSSVNTLSGVAAVSASNVWAVGQYNNSSKIQQTLIEQWNGTAWNVVSSPNVGPGNNNLLGVALVPRSSKLWTVGYSTNSSGIQQTLTESYC